MFLQMLAVIGTGTQAATETGPAPVAAGLSMGERVNGWIDDLLAVGARLVDVPLVVMVPVLIVAAVAVGWGVARVMKKRGKAGASRGAWVTAAVLLGAVAVLLVDRKMARMQGALDAMREQQRADKVALMEAVDKKVVAAVPQKRTEFLVDVAAATKLLTPRFGETAVRPLVVDDATDYYQVHTLNPLSQAYLLVIDLTNPRVKLHLQADFALKTLTSAFAKQSGSSVAINGEAGNSPEQFSGLGTWSGWMVIDGKTIREETRGNPRPFLAFDAKNKASFRSMAASDRTLPKDMPMVIWGRLDAIVDGVVQTVDERNQQPRTAMGINKEGTKLFLMVVDGRQPRYSNGFSRGQVGYFLQAFGANNAMLCDEGGSSCMYLEQLGGIANVPSDNNGQERPTYTHFGISLEKEGAATAPK